METVCIMLMFHESCLSSPERTVGTINIIDSRALRESFAHLKRAFQEGSWLIVTLGAAMNH